ncbi:MAG: TVP38/TMEM64 family protein [Phycisphaeraceae bacterium]
MSPPSGEGLAADAFSADASSTVAVEAGGAWRGLLGVAAIGLVAVLLPGLGAVGLFEPMRDVAEAMRETGFAWWPVFVAVSAIACGLAVVPTHGISLAAGFVFGPVFGTAAAIVAVVAGSAIGWKAAGVAVGTRLRASIDRTAAGRAIAAAMIEARGGRSVLAVTLARLPPQVPFALGNVIAASAGVRLAALLPGTAAGMLPRVALVAWIGGELATFQPGGDARLLVFSIAAATVSLLGLGVWSWRTLRRHARNAESAPLRSPAT